ncbi:MAG: hypothetical protein EBW87_04325 [Burkholderiaceae bacterium]|nr:hypothetical protein [Burkholderiaceae bacterium]
MPELEFTPGPWRECGHEKGGCKCGMIWSRPADRCVASTFVDVDGFGMDVPDEQRIANARLIAAAPDLLEACMAAMRIADLWSPVTGDHDEECAALYAMRQKFESVIAKALEVQ